jgi:short-subunit dehydrogenase
MSGPDGHQALHTPITVVTGGSEGIGLALARQFARDGQAIALVARNPHKLARAAAEIRLHGVPVVEIIQDLCATEAPDRIAAVLAEHGYYVDILINNAGIGLSGAFAAQPGADIDQLVALNVVTSTRLMRQVLPHLLARRRGGILNVASLGGYLPGPHQAAYYASKAYVISLTEAVGWEVKGSGVRIAVLAPGPVQTGFHARMGAERAFYRRLMPSMSPEQVARSGYWGYRMRRRVIVPGVIGPVMALASRLTPHPLLVPLMSWLLTPRHAKRQTTGSAPGRDQGS